MKLVNRVGHHLVYQLQVFVAGQQLPVQLHGGFILAQGRSCLHRFRRMLFQAVEGFLYNWLQQAKIQLLGFTVSFGLGDQVIGKVVAQYRGKVIFQSLCRSGNGNTAGNTLSQCLQAPEHLIAAGFQHDRDRWVTFNFLADRL